MTDIAVDVFNYIFTAILIGVFLAWISLTSSMYKSFTKTPYLDKFENSSDQIPKVSIISVSYTHLTLPTILLV